MYALGPLVKTVGYLRGFRVSSILLWDGGGGGGEVAPGGRKGSLKGLYIKGILDCNELKREKKCIVVASLLLWMVI